MKINDILEALSLINYSVPDYSSFRKRGLDEDEAEETVNLAIEQAFTLLERMRWIPVSERLPDKDGNYLVAFTWSETTLDIARFNGSCFEQVEEDLNVFYRNDIAHWMPLPEPPEQEVE